VDTLYISECTGLWQSWLGFCTLSSLGACFRFHRKISAFYFYWFVDLTTLSCALSCVAPKGMTANKCAHRILHWRLEDWSLRLSFVRF